MAILVALLFCLSPLLGLFFALILFFLDKGKKSYIYSIIISFCFGILAYYFTPLNTYDLVRHQKIVSDLILLPNSNIINYLDKIDLELIPKFYSIIISITKNINLLQFFIVSVGYFLIFYMLNDYRKKTNIKNIYFIPITLYIIFGFNVLYFFSGLYCYIAIIVFTYGLYLEYIKKCDIKLCGILYILAILTHNSMYFPLLLLVLFKLFKEKFNLKLLICGLLLFISSTTLFYFLHLYVKIDIIQKIYRIFHVYTANNQSFIKFYSGIVFYVEIIKITFTMFCTFINYKKNIENTKIYNYITFLSIMTSMMIVKSMVMIRFVMLIQFIGIVPLIDYFTSSRKNKQIVYIAFVCITFLFGIYFFHYIKSFNYNDLFINKFYKTIFGIMK